MTFDIQLKEKAPEEPWILDGKQKETLLAIQDAMVSPLDEAAIERLLEYVDPEDDERKEYVRQYAKFGASNATVETAIDFVANHFTAPRRAPFGQVLAALAEQFRLLPREVRATLLQGWRVSEAPEERGLFAACSILSLHAVFRYSKLFADAMGQTSNACDPVRFQPNYEGPEETRKERLHMSAINDLKEAYDVIVVGSGAGGGVIAAKLAEARKSVLVVERGKYYHESEFIPHEAKAFDTIFQPDMFQMAAGILAVTAKVFGGGTTINFSASINTPDHVRKEWANEGLKFYGTSQYDDHLKFVTERIGVTTNIKHNKPNQALLDGCKKLSELGEDYQGFTAPQNSGGKPHDCGWCFAGCKDAVKNGSTNTWMRDAAQHNAHLIDQATVKEILVEEGKATGVLIMRESQEVTIKARRVVVAAGALNTPSILQDSGLKNTHIGKHLHLHPLGNVIGFFKEKMDICKGTLLSTYATVPNNPNIKLEIQTVHGGLFSALVPWRSSEAHKTAMIRYPNAMNGMFMIRDTATEGELKKEDFDNHVSINYKLSPKDEQNWIDGMIHQLRVFVAAGAREVLTALVGVEPFSFEDEEESDVKNPRFVEWTEKLREYGMPAGSCTFSTAHQMGSCRMGTSPENSATKETGETWDVKNLYVGDGSLLPGPIGVNPMVTIGATSSYVADHIIKSFNETV